MVASVSPSLREPRRVSRPRSSLQTDVHAYQQEQEPAEVASSQARRKLQRHRLSVSEADLFGRAPRAHPSSNSNNSNSNNSAEYDDSASDAPPSDHIPNRDAAYWEARANMHHQYSSHGGVQGDSHRDYQPHTRQPPREYLEPFRERERHEYYAYQNPNPNPYPAPAQHYPNPNSNSNSNPNNYRNPEPTPSVRLLRPSEVAPSSKPSNYNPPGNQPMYNEQPSNQYDRHPLSYSRLEQVQQPPQPQPPQQATQNYRNVSSTQQPSISRQPQYSRKPEEKPVLISTSATTVADKNIIANNIKMLRSASMPISQQKNGNPSQGVQLLSSHSAKHGLPTAEQVKSTTLLSPASLAVPQGIFLLLILYFILSYSIEL